MSLTIRLATENDVGSIGDIFNHYIEHSTCTFQVAIKTHTEHRDWFRDRSELHPVIVAETDPTIVGWASLSPWRPKEAYRHSL